MSVILTACRKSKQRAIENHMKEKAKKAAEKRQKKETAWTQGAEPVQEYFSPLPTESPDTKIWSFELSNDYYYVIFYKYTGEVYCNEEKMETLDTLSEVDSGMTLDFAMNGHKARISVSSDGSDLILTVNGHPVAE